MGSVETEKARSCQPSAALGKRKSPAGGAPGFGKEGVVNGAEILGHWGGVNVYHCFVVTSNRAVEEWLTLFDDPILGNSALDRLANASYQIVIEGSSHRERLSPHRKLRGLEEVIDSPAAT